MNRNSIVDLYLSTQSGAILHYGTSYSHYEFDNQAQGHNSALSLGLKTNPLNDWVFDFDLAYTQVSKQMFILNPSIALLRYFKKADLQLRVGYRTIELEITERLQNLSPNTLYPIRDENFWWSLRTGLYLSRSTILDLSYTQFQYSKRFNLLSAPAAPFLGYHWSTINFGGTLADYLYSIRLSHNYKKWIFALSYNFIENEFDDSSVISVVPSLSYRINTRWSLDLDLGYSRGSAVEASDREDGFLGLGINYQW